MDNQKTGPKRINAQSMIGHNYNIVDKKKFDQAIQLLKESLFDKGATLFASDNIITWNRNLSFLREDFYRGGLENDGQSIYEKSIVWRTYILLYFAELASRCDGDFVEMGCLKGYTASRIIERLDFVKLGKRFFLYDLFEWKEGDEHSRHTALDNPNLYEEVKERFCLFDFVTVIKGSVPESFKDGFPDKIAFAHIDMNHPDPEVGALKAVLPRLVKGGAVVLDDYGWWWYSAQKIALDPIIREHGFNVLELPTGQGLILR